MPHMLVPSDYVPVDVEDVGLLVTGGILSTLGMSLLHQSIELKHDDTSNKRVTQKTLFMGLSVIVYFIGWGLVLAALYGTNKYDSASFAFGLLSFIGITLLLAFERTSSLTTGVIWIACTLTLICLLGMGISSSVKDTDSGTLTEKRDFGIPGALLIMSGYLMYGLQRSRDWEKFSLFPILICLGWALFSVGHGVA